MSISFRSVVGSFCVLAASLMTQTTYAHFLWLKTMDEAGQPQAYLYFGESASDEAYHFPERLEAAEVYLRGADGKRTKLDVEALESDDRAGKVAPLGDATTFALESTKQYGLHHGKSLLIYYAKHLKSDSAEAFNAVGKSDGLKLEIVPKINGGDLELTVYWEGKPLPEAEVSVVQGDEEAEEKTTDAEGRVSVQLKGEGLISALTNHLEKEKKGEVDGNPYEGILHYTSLTFARPSAGGADESKVSASKPLGTVAPLPEALSSFGAVVSDGWLYVYGGHTGEEHQHSAANLSQHFRRFKLDGGTAWEELPMQMPLQGLALVAHGGKVYRVGGLNARNATTEDEEDLHSTDGFAVYDPSTGKWESLAPLPAPRSSHNAVTIGDRLYVVGGWHLHGESPGDWQVDGLVYDLTKPQAGWQKLPEPPFKRRALAVAEWQGKLVAIGGMNEKAKISQRVDIFDPATDRWSRGPDLPGTGMAGFGSSACSQDSQLYASGLKGIVYRLSDAGSAWEEAARLDKPRFFHQLLPAGGGELLAVAGASREGHLADIESVEVNGEPGSKRETASLTSQGGAEPL